MSTALVKNGSFEDPGTSNVKGSADCWAETAVYSVYECACFDGASGLDCGVETWDEGFLSELPMFGDGLQPESKSGGIQQENFDSWAPILNYLNFEESDKGIETFFIYDITEDNFFKNTVSKNSNIRESFEAEPTYIELNSVPEKDAEQFVDPLWPAL